MRRFWEFIKGVKWFSWLLLIIWIWVSLSSVYAKEGKYLDAFLIFGFMLFLPIPVYEFTKNPVFQKFWEKKSRYKIVNSLKALSVASKILIVYWLVMVAATANQGFIEIVGSAIGVIVVYIAISAYFVFLIFVAEMIAISMKRFKDEKAKKSDSLGMPTQSLVEGSSSASGQIKKRDIPFETDHTFDTTDEKKSVSKEREYQFKAGAFSQDEDRKLHQEELKRHLLEERERRQKEEQRLAEERERRRKEEEERRKREDYERFIHERDATSQKKQQRRQRYQQQYSVDLCRVDSVDFMEGHSFEHFCADLLRDNGYIRVSVTPGSGDQGADVIAEKDGIRYAVQCKNYASSLSNTPVQEVNAGKMMYKCHVGVVMTNSTFTPGAKALAEATGVLLWDRSVLQKMMQSLI